jgi:hypothetical protein
MYFSPLPALAYISLISFLIQDNRFIIALANVYRGGWVRLPAEVIGFYLIHNVETDSGVHPAFRTMRIWRE